jgi:DNA-binding transcriptional MerR regulator
VTTYRIAEVARRSGFSPPTLRYYEDIGLLPPAPRGDNGYRTYDDATLERLRFITRAKQLGCSLDEIAELAEAWDGGHCAHVQQRLRAAVDAKMADAQARIAELAALVTELQQATVALSTHTADGPCDDACGCLPDDGPPGASTPTQVALTTKPVWPSRHGPDGRNPGADGIPSELIGEEGSGASVGLAGETGWRAQDEAIVCRLGAGESERRVDEWRRVLADVRGREEIEGGVRLVFDAGDPAPLGDIARLAAAEADCCRFFAFALTIDPRGTALEVRAPADGQEVLRALFSTP